MPAEGVARQTNTGLLHGSFYEVKNYMECVKNLLDRVASVGERAEENMKEHDFLAETGEMKQKLKEMGTDMCQKELKENEENEEVIKKANTILQKDK